MCLMRWMFGLDDLDFFYVLYVLDDLDYLDVLDVLDLAKVLLNCSLHFTQFTLSQWLNDFISIGAEMLQSY